MSTLEMPMQSAPGASLDGSVKISAQDVSHDYYIERSGEVVTGLGDFTADIYDGEFICIVGPSGCGKSTFLRLVAGLESPTRGVLKVNGEVVHGPGADRGMAFQAYALFPWKTLKGNVEFGSHIRRLPKEERDRLALHFINLVGLKGLENKYPHELSGGQQQRGSLARLFANDPDVLLMDEPLGAVDAQTREFLQEELLNLWSKYRKTVLFVTHSIDEAVFLADRIMVMSRRPGHVKETIENPLSRPRTFEMRAGDQFGQVVYRVGSLVRQEIDRH